MIIRDLTPGDVGACTDIVCSHWDETAARRAHKQLSDKLARYYVADDNGIVGFCGAHRSVIMWRAWEISWIAVQDEARELGFGRRLMDHTLNSIARDHASMVMLMTEHPKFFQKFNFVEVADLDGFKLMILKLRNVSVVSPIPH